MKGLGKDKGASTTITSIIYGPICHWQQSAGFYKRIFSNLRYL